MGNYGNPYHFIPNYIENPGFSKIKNEKLINEFKWKTDRFKPAETPPFSIFSLVYDATKMPDNKLVYSNSNCPEYNLE